MAWHEEKTGRFAGPLVDLTEEERKKQDTYKRLTSAPVIRKPLSKKPNILSGNKKGK